MILDLHVHSAYSGDSPIAPREYALRMRKMRKHYDIDGFALMEHNYLVAGDDEDLEALGRDTGLVILAGVEVDTFWGHVLAYGMTPDWWNEIRESRKQEPIEFARQAFERGVTLAPSHPFRWPIGVGDRTLELEGVCAIETINNSNEDYENSMAIRFARAKGLIGIGGSDAHFLPELGGALTRFERPVTNMEALASEIRAGRCEAIRLEDARRQNR